MTSSSMICVQDVSHVRLAAPDLATMRSFLLDFGLDCFEDQSRLYARGCDGMPFAHVTERGRPAFLALGLRAESEAELQRLAEQTGAPLAALEAPGGGKVVRMQDPDGNVVEVVAGQTRSAPAVPITESLTNSAAVRRRLGAAIRVIPRASQVYRLGHVVLNVRDYARSVAWYKQHFGFITSHEIEAAPGVAIGAFLRCDRGEIPTDHHSMFLLQLPAAGGALNHAAFEVLGLDDLMVGHAHLKARDRKLAWGVGRHKLGSQIFDYWKDPWGNELEHWTDGDLFTAADGSEKASFRELIDVQWGTPFPKLAARFAPSPEVLAKLIAFGVRARRRLAGSKLGGVT
jgi:catechol 2,3-dioxygenase-like lactoylglutathione lyase family enzyme